MHSLHLQPSCSPTPNTQPQAKLTQGEVETRRRRGAASLVPSLQSLQLPGRWSARCLASRCKGCSPHVPLRFQATAGSPHSPPHCSDQGYATATRRRRRGDDAVMTRRPHRCSLQPSPAPPSKQLLQPQPAQPIQPLPSASLQPSSPSSLQPLQPLQQHKH